MQTPSKPEHESALADHLWHLEETLWTSGRDSARAVLAAGTIAILPYPDGILQGDALLRRLPANTGWRLIEIDNRTMKHHGAVAILAYRVHAEKPGSPIYKALCTSTWLNDDGHWLRISHQHTPVE